MAFAASAYFVPFLACGTCRGLFGDSCMPRTALKGRDLSCSFREWPSCYFSGFTQWVSQRHESLITKGLAEGLHIVAKER